MRLFRKVVYTLGSFLKRSYTAREKNMFEEWANPSTSVGLVICVPSSSRMVWVSRMVRLPTFSSASGTLTLVFTVAPPISRSAMADASLNVDPGVIRVRMAWLMFSW